MKKIESEEGYWTLGVKTEGKELSVVEWDEKLEKHAAEMAQDAETARQARPEIGAW